MTPSEFKEYVDAWRGPAPTPEQIESNNKKLIIRGFVCILVMIAALLAYSVVFTEQPMLDMAPADKQNYRILELIAVQIFSVLAIILGAKAMSTPPAPASSGSPVSDPSPEKTVTQTVIVNQEDGDDAKPV